MICLIISVIVIIYAAQVLNYAVHMFQQNGYKNRVHAAWVVKNYGRHFTRCFSTASAKKSRSREEPPKGDSPFALRNGLDEAPAGETRFP